MSGETCRAHDAIFAYPVVIVIHPARLIPVALLVRQLEERARLGLVRVVSQGPLRLYVYSQRCVFEAAWDSITELARGLVVDIEQLKLLATPFPKFFNFGERSATLPSEPFEVFEKLDGSLGIVFHDGNAWRVVTKGSFNADQSAWAMNWLEQQQIALSNMTPGWTYLFEIIYQANRVVVRYTHEGLTLLGAYRENGEEETDLDSLAQKLGTAVAKRHAFDSIAKAVAVAEQLDADNEGFVVRFAGGFRVKLKGEAYLRIHRMITRVTPLGVWEMMRAQDDLVAIRKEMPEEVWGDFDQIHAVLRRQFDELVAKVEGGRATVADLTDKELGLRLSTLPDDVRPFIFASRKRPDWTEEARTRDAMYRLIRPSGNDLPGYVPTRLLCAILDDGG
jgi:RNA ligase